MPTEPTAAIPPCPRPTGIACEVEPCWCRAETAAPPPRYVSQAEAERMVETARAMVTAYDGMLGASFWIEYGALKSEIEEFERTWANVQP